MRENAVRKRVTNRHLLQKIMHNPVIYITDLFNNTTIKFDMSWKISLIKKIKKSFRMPESDFIEKATKLRCQ